MMVDSGTLPMDTLILFDPLSRWWSAARSGVEGALLFLHIYQTETAVSKQETLAVSGIFFFLQALQPAPEEKDFVELPPPFKPPPPTLVCSREQRLLSSRFD